MSKIKTQLVELPTVYSRFKIPEYWTYYCDYDNNKSDCICDDQYCRCGVVSPVINNLYYKNIYNAIISKNQESKIMEYCLDRVIRILLKNDSFDAYGVPGYYGEDVEIKILPEDRIKFSNALELLCQCSTDAERIEYVLGLEYGYLIDCVKNKEWEIKTVEIDQIRLTDMKSISQKVIETYDGDETILCVTLDDNHYRLIDGRHRLNAAVRHCNSTINILTTK